ncbi:Acetyltransferase (GNAT) family protein [Catalinimonas alkaloidigena]|uniref:Acetyltransferase (GNAT) family protein n=1 Tax=Catalinimonas alkaloidigena TaxID=1075417 RepID=A0A1G9R3S4_9BACT|nr:GNAT family N-acetyltransferase [Catalinimonas alkaloidigena]SDM17962.1 Acetyltransferase (GNAT) family protein [Catalinimonas alkaloidigena]
MSPEIRPITAAETRLLRHRVLRPRQKPNTLIFTGDTHPLALHAGAFVPDPAEAERLVGIASVTPEPCPAAPRAFGWRLRGMATLPDVQRKGFGAALVNACLDHIRKHGGTVVWCQGRTSALPFYRAMGFEPYGEEFNVPLSGPHFLLWRSLS